MATTSALEWDKGLTLLSLLRRRRLLLLFRLILLPL